MQNPAVLLSEEGASCEPKLQKGIARSRNVPILKNFPTTQSDEVSCGLVIASEFSLIGL